MYRNFHVFNPSEIHFLVMMQVHIENKSSRHYLLSCPFLPHYSTIVAMTSFIYVRVCLWGSYFCFFGIFVCLCTCNTLVKLSITREIPWAHSFHPHAHFFFNSVLAILFFSLVMFFLLLFCINFTISLSDPPKTI